MRTFTTSKALPIFLKADIEKLKHDYNHVVKGDDELNLLLRLLEEYSKKKIHNSNMHLRLYRQLYLFLFMGIVSFVLFYFYRSYLPSFYSRQPSPDSTVIMTALGVQVSALTTLHQSRKEIKEAKAFFYIFSFSCFFTISAFFLPLFPFLIFGVFSVLIILTFRELRSVDNKKKTIDRNLSRIIRTTSQAREHVHSGFGKKVELDVRLTEAEDALENPRLYI